MSNIRKLIKEKFGYTTNLPSVNDMHKDVTDKNGRDNLDNPSYLPVEKFRKIIKHLMGSTTTEEDGKIENSLDFQALHRLANKYALAPAFMENLNVIQVHLDKGKAGDRKEIEKAWNAIKDNVPFWFLGMLPHGDDKRELPEDDKKLLTNLQEMMAEFNKTSEKAGKELAKNTEHASRDTQAKDNLDKARKSAKMDTDAGSEKKLKEKPENKIE